MQGQPFNYGEVANLTNFGIENQHFKFGVLSFESDKYISVKEPSIDGSGNLIVIEPNNNFKFTKKPNKAEAAIMHPEQNIIALKGKVGDNKYILQVFSLEPQKKLKAVEVNEPIVFWKWLNPNKLGFVTGTSAYAINIYNENEDKIKLFDRAGTLTGPCQVIGFSIDPTEKWGLLSAISSPDGGKTINGHMQLCLIEGQKSQILDGHCGCFGEVFYHSGDYKSTIIAFFERKPNETTQRVHLTEISAPKEGQPKLKKVCELQMPPQFPNDFPVFMHIASKHGLLYLLTKFGHFFVVEISSAAVIGTGKLSNDAIFIGAKDSKTDGALVITRSGNLIRLTVDENNLVKFISTSCGHIPGNAQVGTRLALHYKLPGAENILMEQFNQAFISGDYVAAARIAADSPGASIRNAQTIQKFKSAPPQPGRPQPVLQYFSTLLEKGKLNALESVELVGPVLAQGKLNFIEGWLKDNKLECTEELGRLIEKTSPQLALTVYEKGGLQNLKAQVLMNLGRGDEAVQILKSTGNVDWLSLIRSTVQTNPDAALNTAKEAAKNGANIYQIAEIFLSNNRIQELTGFLVENMKENRSDDAQWQTRVLELNLMAFPQVADAIFQMEIWKIYDRKRIGQLCEQKGLAQRALENYTDFQDIRRVILNYTVNLNQEWLGKYLGNLEAQICLNVLKDLLKQNRQNTQLVVQVAIANNQKLGAQNIIQIFESMGSFDGIYYFLGSIINNSQDPDLYFKYIEAAAKCNQTRDVERIIRETKFYDPVKVKDFLMEIKMTDPKPLMFLCDMHNFVDDLTRYLVKNNFFKHIEVYVLRLSPQSAPIVLGTLIDLETDEKYILGLLSGIRSNCPIEQLVAEFEKRNKLRMLESWLEARVSEGNQVPALHNALAKICIDTNKDPQNFLTNNPYYDSKVVGKYAEEIDPHLAIIAYKRAWGQCDQELVETTDKYKMFRIQAKYLVERRDKALWNIVLNPENPNRKDLIEQVVSSALPDSKNADEVIVSIEAFMAADLPNELISLLEKIVLHNSEFSGYRKLQNLLIITAIKSDKTRVMDYINRLDNYDGDEIAKIALGEDYQLYEEAFVIYKKMKKFPEAIDVLLNNIESIPRAAEFAEKVNEPTCWSRLGNAYLLTNQVTESIESFMKANDAQSYGGVIPAAIREEKFELLTKYLLMARQQVKDVAIDTELVYCLAKTQKLGELETFITEPNSADLPRIGDRIYEDGLYEAARLIFVRLKNNAKIASCLVKLKKFGQALEAAKKANTPKTWKELCIACVAAKEYKIANAAGMNIVIHPDHLDELILNYEKYGCADEMIALLEQAMGLERAHVGIYTELGILYAKYHPERLMEHIKNNFQRLNVSKLLRTCERYQLWPETVYLYTNYNEFDNAILTMIEHSPSAWQHEQFANLIQKVSNTDLYYKAVLFYLEEQPMQLNDLLKSLATKMDLSKLISVMRKTGHLPLITPFMKNVQNQNNQAVNEALNELYLEGEDHENLWLSVTQYENIDQLSLAQQTERHHLIEFRRISAYLYRRNQKYAQSIALSKQDKQYRDAVETAQESGNSDVIEDLIKFFIENKEKEYFTVCLYTCYEFLRPDLVLELSWRYGLFQFSMPYFIQLVRDLTSRVDTVQKKHDEREKKEEKQAAQQMAAPGLDIMQDMGLLMPGLSGLPMLMGPDMGMGMPGMGGMGAMGGMGGMGAGMGGMGAGMGGMGGPMGGAPPMGGMGGFNNAPGFNPRGGF